MVSLAPAYSGAITGFAFFFVACAGIVNPLITKAIVQVNFAVIFKQLKWLQSGSELEWNMVFYVSTVIALLPILVFNLWGSAEVQPWARSKKQDATKPKIEEMC